MPAKRRYWLAINLNFELTLNYQLNEKWKFATNLVYATGIAVTMPEAVQTPFFEGGNELTYIFTKRNNQRFPAYHRLDLSATKQFTTKRGNEAALSFGIYNTYGRRNPFYLSYALEGEYIDDFNKDMRKGYFDVWHF